MNKFLVVIVTMFMAVAVQAQPIEQIVNLFETDSANVQVKTVGENFTLYYFNGHLVVLEKLGAVSYELYLDRYFAGHLDSTAYSPARQGYYAPATISNVARIKCGQGVALLSEHIKKILAESPESIDESAVPEHQREFSAFGMSNFWFYLSLYPSLDLELFVPNLLSEIWAERISADFQQVHKNLPKLRRHVEGMIEIFSDSYKETPKKNEQYQKKLEEIASLI